MDLSNNYIGSFTYKSSGRGHASDLSNDPKLNFVVATSQQRLLKGISGMVWQGKSSQVILWKKSNVNDEFRKAKTKTVGVMIHVKSACYANQTLSSFNLSSTKSIIDDLNLVQQRFVNQLPLIITVLGLIGFIGNLFTFLQPKLRNNSFCIYTLTASFADIINLFVNLFPQYLDPTSGNLLSNISDRFTCKLKLFLLGFFPQLPLDLLIMSLIDRYACTFGPTSRISRLLRLKTVPWMIFITIIITGIISLFSPLLYDVIPGYGCTSTHPTISAVGYITINGIITPMIMLILLLLTYRNFLRRRQRVVSTSVDVVDPLSSMCLL
ncbi:unnamed protein product [Adineta ricciae]|uniref:G-protein coupled receptors family 1 profile domain-containing protein n=1 Tax=Adineta ricciae TaxID=249248 RepID=A0A815UPJ5_ADIRI|nr:unnamed protein product [Adineta ricciae]